MINLKFTEADRNSAYDKVMCVILSCVTEHHFEVADNMVENFYQLYKDVLDYFVLKGMLIGAKKEKLK